MTTGQQNSRVGSWFGPYRLNRLLGRGGMGEVYEAEDTRKGRVVALKLISPDFSNDPMYRERMQREAGAAGRLTEPHVVPIHDYGEINGQLYLDMRLIDGGSLAAALSRTGPMNAPRAVAIVRQVAAALDAAHGNGIIHRDVKPENILLTGDDFAYLVDFGIARAGEDAGVTQVGMAIGTYRYMAPERFSDSEVTYRSDIYSLACVLGECLIGAPPFRGESVERLVAAHLMEPVPRPSQLLPGRVPPALDEVLAKGMAKNPADRYRSAGELAQAALSALTNTEQHQAKSILQQTEAAAGAQTALRPALSDPGSRGWRAPPTAMSGGRPAPPTGIAPVPRTPPPADTGGWAGPPTGIAPSPGMSSRAPRQPDFRPQSQEQPHKRKLWLILGAAAVAVLLAVVAAFVFRPGEGPAAEACGQNVLPFNGLTFRLSPGAVAVDSAGAIYVTNQGMYGRVVKLSPGSDTPTVLPFTGLYQPQGVAVDSAGAVYVTDFNHRVVMMASGSNSQTELPFAGLSFPEGVAVDKAGTVYVADRGNDRVVKLAAGSKTPEVLPFNGLDNPDGVAVDDAGNVLVTDTDNNRVLKLAPGSTEELVLPFTGISVPWGIAVNAAGDVYVSEHDDNQVVKLPANATAPTPLTLNGLNTPLQLAVDKDGNLYIADRGNDRVVKLHVAGCPS